MYQEQNFRCQHFKMKPMKRGIDQMNKARSLSIIILLALPLFIFTQSFVTPTTLSLYISFIGCIAGGILLITGKIKSPTICCTKSEGIFISFLMLTIIISSFKNSIYLEYILSGISLLLLYGVTRRIDLNRSWLLMGFTLLSITQAGYGIGQYLHWLPNWNSAFPACGSFDNPAGFAASLVVLFPFALQQIKRESYYWRAFGAMGATLMITAVALSESRAGITAQAVILGVWIYWSYQGIPKKS